jgi:hypothetical protein
MLRITAILLFSSLLSVSAAFTQPGIYADAKPLAKRIRQLAAPSEEPTSARISAAKSVSADIADLVIRTLDRDPSTRAQQLEQRLVTLICQAPDNEVCYPGGHPKIFAQDWGPAATMRQIVIAYQLNLGCMGPGCTLVRIETFVWEKATGKAYSTARGGGALNGRMVSFEQIASYADRWIMASGPMTGWSGRTFGGRAILYRINSGEVQPIWDRSLAGLTVQRNELGWEANYADQKRFYSNEPHPYVFDVYALNWQDRTFRRVIHHRY